MRCIYFVLFSTLSLTRLHAQATGVQLLQNEPEWAVIKGTGAAPYMNGDHPTSPLASAAQNYGRYEAVRGEIMTLNERLLDNLLVCASQCKDQDAREDEFWILQHNLPSYNLAPMKNRAETKVDARWSYANTTDFNSPDGRSWSLLREHCYAESGIKPGQENEYWDESVGHSVLQSPEMKKRFNDCKADPLAIGFKHTGIDASIRGGRWKTHVAIWKYCSTMYHVETSIFQQAAYDA